ncbi:hypothetical protein BGZ98_009704, partial [Dissophora globulifera]
SPSEQNTSSNVAPYRQHQRHEHLRLSNDTAEATEQKDIPDRKNESTGAETKAETRREETKTTLSQILTKERQEYANKLDIDYKLRAARKNLARYQCT